MDIQDDDVFIGAEFDGHRRSTLPRPPGDEGPGEFEQQGAGQNQLTPTPSSGSVADA